MESPTRWLHRFMFRQDFEIIIDSLYTSCSREYFSFVANKLMWENATQMKIVSLNWWQYAARVWGHANSAQTFTTYWWNMILPFWPLHKKRVCPALVARRALARRGMLSTRVRTLPGRTAAHVWWTALFSSAMGEGGSSMSWIQTDIWSQTCSIGFMSGLRCGQSMTSTSCWSRKAAVSRAV